MNVPARRWIWIRPVSEDHPLVVRLRAERPGLWEALPREADAALRERFGSTAAELADLRARLGVPAPVPERRELQPGLAPWLGRAPDLVVAARFRVPVSRVRRWRRDHQLAPPPDRTPPELLDAELPGLRDRLGERDADLARDFSVPAAFVRAVRTDQRRPAEPTGASPGAARRALAAGLLGVWPDRLVAARFGLTDDEARQVRELAGVPPGPPVGRDQLKAWIEEHHPGLLERLAASDPGLRLPAPFLELLRELLGLERPRPTPAVCEAAWLGARHGASWREVARRLDLASAAVARDAARSWAREQRLPFPPAPSAAPEPPGQSAKRPTTSR